MVAGKFCAWSCRRSANYYGKTPPPVDAPGEVGARGSGVHVEWLVAMTW